MATQSTNGRSPGVGLLAAAAGLTVTLLAAYAVCWLASALPGAGAFAHNWLNLFSPRSPGSIDQLVGGAIYSAISAGFAALIFVPVYNLTARTDRII